MDNVLIWGVGKTYSILKKYIYKLVDEKKIEICALIHQSDKEKEYIDGYLALTKESVNRLDFDLILICAETEKAEDIRKDIEDLGIDLAKVMTCIDFLMQSGVMDEEYSEALKRQTKVLGEILAASDEEVASYDWMYNRVARYGIYPFVDSSDPSICNSFWGLLQSIGEFTRFCNYISHISVNKAIEIGVFKGRSSYFICAVLFRNNPSLQYNCVDIYDNMDNFELFREILPCLNKCIPSTSADYANDPFEFVFIDADHSYEGSMTDYRNVGRKALKYVVFHDIYGNEYAKLNGGVPRTWREVVEENPDCENIVFSDYPNKWMGIGVIKKSLKS